MNDKTRESIIDVCKKQGFNVILKETGKEDRYVKVLKFESASSSPPIYIDKCIGISALSGDIDYLKVALHPNQFKESLINKEAGIEECLNKRTKINRHSNSNYLSFPVYKGNKEPCAKCYKVSDVFSLEKLLKGLTVLGRSDKR